MFAESCRGSAQEFGKWALDRLINARGLMGHEILIRYKFGSRIRINHA
jgi:hypothetical protein